jgi:hypothetical protein
MKKKREIRIKSPQLKILRNNLREFISIAQNIRARSMIEEKLELDLSDDKARERNKELAGELDSLETSWQKSICVCPKCKSQTKNMIFNPVLEQWFCVDCYSFNSDFYRRKAQEGEIWKDESGLTSDKWYP